MKRFVNILLFVAALGLNAWANPQGQTGSYKNMTNNKFEKVIQKKKVQLVDVRTPEEFANGHLYGSINIDYQDERFAETAENVLDKNRPIALYCRTGRRSRLAADILSQKGFDKIYHLDKGITSWMEDGHEVTPKVALANHKQTVDIDVMTFNIRLDTKVDSLNNWKYRVDNVGMMLNYYQPDIIGTQEVCNNQFNDLKKQLAQYTALGVGRDDGKDAGERCAIFYKTNRFEQLDYGNFSLSETPDSLGVLGWDAACKRIATWVKLKDRMSGKVFIAMNTHLDHIGPVARRESAHLLMAKINELCENTPVVLTGDFNGTPDSEPIQILLSESLKDCRLIANVVYTPGALWSFHDFGRRPVEKRPLLDYVFVRQMKANKYRIVTDRPGDGYLSDHAPVMVNLTLEE